MTKRNRNMSFKVGLTITALGLSLGVVGYQSIAVRRGPAPVHAKSSPSLEEVRRLAASLAPASLEPRPSSAAANAVATLPLARRGGFVALPSAPAKAESGGTAHRRASAAGATRPRVAANRSMSRESPFKKNARAPITRALNEKFYSAASFGFSPKIKATHAGRAVVRTRSSGHN